MKYPWLDSFQLSPFHQQPQVFLADVNPVTAATIGAVIFAVLVPYAGRIALASVKIYEGVVTAFDGRNSERKLKIETYKEFLDEIRRRDEALTRSSELITQTQTTFNTQAAQHAEDRRNSEARIAEMVQTIKERDVQVEALTKETVRLQGIEEERNQLLIRVKQLEDRLKQYESGNLETIKKEQA